MTLRIKSPPPGTTTYIVFKKKTHKQKTVFPFDVNFFLFYDFRVFLRYFCYQLSRDLDFCIALTYLIKAPLGTLNMLIHSRLLRCTPRLY